MNYNKAKYVWSKNEIILSAVMTFLFSAVMFVLLMSPFFTHGTTFTQAVIKQPLQHILLFMLMLFVMGMSYIIINVDTNLKMSPLKAQSLVLLAIMLTIVLIIASDYYFGRYARPMALAGIFITVVLNKRTAFYANVAIAMIFLMAEGYINNFDVDVVIPTIANLFASVIMSVAVSRNDTRLRTVYTVVAMVPFFILINLAFHIVFNPFSVGELKIILVQSALSPIIAGFIYLGILPIFEAVFKIITPYYLTELTDSTKGILFDLSVKAPGTYNHSLAVANLVGACALAIGEDVLLARASAYYHDVGKLNDPNVYKENLISDEQNPHDKLTPELSVSLIKRHVSYGVEQLKKRGLPQEIINAAAEHHGTMPMKFFYFKAKKFTDGTVNMAGYSYDGPTPTSKITAILMIADGCEAAVRTLSDRSTDKIDDIVRGIIEERMELEQFDQCDITFKDLQIIRRTIVDNFAGIYHERIAYPKFKITKEERIISD